MLILNNISLRSCNTFQVECSTRYFAELNFPGDLFELLPVKEYSNSEKLVLGGGSNVLFAGDFKGIILLVKFKGIHVISESKSSVIVKAYAGESWDDFVNYCVHRNYYGIENLSLIPGSIGATPVQNIGAYGVEVKDVIFEVETYNLETGRLRIFSNQECNFGYRDSIFKNELRGKLLVSSVTFKLSRKKKFNLSYPSLREQFAKLKTEEIDLSLVREKIIEIRKSKLPDWTVQGNAGSFFKNPIIGKDMADQIKKDYPDVIFFNNNHDSVKIPAGWLIEKCGLKGFRSGKAGVHDKQALVIVNFGGASGKEVRDIAFEVRDTVAQKFGIHLETEVNIFE